MGTTIYTYSEEREMSPKAVLQKQKHFDICTECLLFLFR